MTPRHEDRGSFANGWNGCRYRVRRVRPIRRASLTLRRVPRYKCDRGVAHLEIVFEIVNLVNVVGSSVTAKTGHIFNLNVAISLNDKVHYKGQRRKNTQDKYKNTIRLKTTQANLPVALAAAVASQASQVTSHLHPNATTRPTDLN